MSFFRSSFFGFAFLICLISCKNTETQKTDTPQSKDTVKVAVPKVETIQERRARLEADVPDIDPIPQEELIPFLTQYGKDNPETRIKISSEYGDIIVQLYRDTPLHRANFIRLAKLGYFDTTFFHRVSPDFVVQGGNSDRTDTAKMRTAIGNYLIPSEFDAGYSHNRGAFAAAKYAEQNVSKASSPFEFYVVQKQDGAHHIDRDHTVFGRVISGMDVIDSINEVPIDESEWPLRNIPIKVEVLD